MQQPALKFTDPKLVHYELIKNSDSIRQICTIVLLTNNYRSLLSNLFKSVKTHPLSRDNDQAKKHSTALEIEIIFLVPF